MFKHKRHNTKSQPGSILQESVNHYLSGLQALQFSPRSIQIYRQALERFLCFLTDQGRERVQDITITDLEAYRLALVQSNFAPSSLEVYMRAVRQFFAHLDQHQKLFINPAATLVIPKPPRKLMPAPSEEDITKLLAQPNVTTRCGLRDRAFLETAYATGARREEMTALTIFDLNLDDGTLRVMGKGRKERVLPLGKHAVDWLSRYIRDVRPRMLKNNLNDPALWIDIRGKRLTYSAIEVMVKNHARDAGTSTRISPHALRRACATHMLRRGAHPFQLQMLLGHSSLKTLTQYLRLTIADLKTTHAQTNPGK